ncbi:MAG TPA: PilX N-terminal domain-containing pilus assembly protein [Steroidobacteraceae bacterium]|nr:PilX N-terminal domain-containing pilus assembly protein [Steroidobacteraceae bacterium]
MFHCNDTAAEATSRDRQRGVVLISTMLLLMVMTIFALSMFRSYGLQDKIAGNVREKQRALHSAISAEQYAETWLSLLTTTTPVVLPCAGAVSVTKASDVQICSNQMSQAQVLSVPWANYFAYNAPTITSYGAVGANQFAQAPQFYIYDLGASGFGWGELYQVDAWSYATTNATVAVVESTYLVKSKWNGLTASTNGGGG